MHVFGAFVVFFASKSSIVPSLVRIVKRRSNSFSGEEIIDFSNSLKDILDAYGEPVLDREISIER